MNLLHHRPRYRSRGLLFGVVLLGIGLMISASLPPNYFPEASGILFDPQAPLSTTSSMQEKQVLRFSTYYGGSDVESSASLALDTQGYVYTSGQTTSGDLPTPNALFAFKGGLVLDSDVYIAKFNPGGDTLVYATYLGGTSDELIADLVVADDGTLFVAGGTASDDFPSQNALHSFQGGVLLQSDGFISRLNANGTALDFSTYLGGSGDDGVSALALDDDGNLYVAGSTTSDDFPTTPGSFQNTRPDTLEQRADIFVAKLRPDGNNSYAIEYATYLGGNGDEAPVRIAVDAEGHLWITGFTNSGDFPTQNALQDTYAGPIRNLEGDLFIARLNEDGTALDFSTFLGGNQNDQGTSLALDEARNVYVAGWTESNDFPTTPEAYETQRQGIRDAFVLKLTPMGENAWMLDYSTRLASTGYEMGRMGLAVDKAGRTWVSGATSSDQFPTKEPTQISFGGGETDAFLARLDASGSVLGFATYLGGAGADVATGIALGADAVCLTGSTSSTNFPTYGALQPLFDGPSAAGLDVSSTFISCFETKNEAPALSRMALSPDSVALITGQTQQFLASGFDQFDQPLLVQPVWSATGGTIDSTGLYTAGDDAGLFSVFAADTASGRLVGATVNIISGVATEDEADVPSDFALYGNYPNPFNPQTTIRFDVKASVRVVLTIFDVLGRKQATLVEKDYAPGRYAVHFDARGWPSGTYFYAIEMGDADSGQGFRDVKQMVLVR